MNPASGKRANQTMRRTPRRRTMLGLETLVEYRRNGSMSFLPHDGRSSNPKRRSHQRVAGRWFATRS